MESVERYLVDYCEHGRVEGIESYTQDPQICSGEGQAHEDVRSDDGNQRITDL
jgi:hypothetical protein